MRRSRPVNDVPFAGRAPLVAILMALIAATLGAAPDDAAPPGAPDFARVDDVTYVSTCGHFVVRGHNEPLVDLLASRAEQTLTRLRREHLAPPKPMTPIEIIVHPSREAYRAAVGAGPADTDARTIIHRAEDDAPPRCTIHLIQRTDTGSFDGRLIERILPHEVAHVALAERFIKAPAPLYLQEGLAVAAQSDHHRTAILLVGLAVAEGRDVPLAELVRRRDADDADDAALFYAQSYSLVTYLRRQMTDRQFERFLDELGRGQATFDALRRALRVGYDARFAAKLQQAWRDDAVRQASLVAASGPADDSTSRPAETD